MVKKRGPINPYLVGPPITGEYGFYGRQNLLESVVNTLTHTRQNTIVIHGQRRVGKSSLLFRLHRDEMLRQDYFPIFLDMQLYEGFPPARILANLAQTIRNELRLSLPLPTEADLSTDYGQFHRVFLPEVYQHLDHKRILILIDEFDVIVPSTLTAPVSANTILGYLQTLIAENQDFLAFVFVVGQRLDLLGEGYRRLFKGAYSQPVGRLGEDETYNLLTELGKKGNIYYTDEALVEIWNLTDGQPYFTQLIGFEIFEHLQKQKNQRATAADVTVCLDKAFERGQGALDWLWRGFEPEQQWVLSAIAEVADRQQSVSDTEIAKTLEHYLLIMTPLAREKAYRHLLQSDFLVQTDKQQYRFTLEFFRRWVVKYHPLQEIQRQIEEISPEALNYYQLGLHAFGRGSLAQAIENYRLALEHNPYFARAHLDMAVALRAQGNIEEAIAEYEEAYQLDPDSAREELIDLRLIHARQLENEADPEGTLIQVRRILEIQPDHPDARQLLIDNIIFDQISTYLRQGDLPGAFDTVQDLIKSSYGIEVEKADQRMRELWLKFGLQAVRDLHWIQATKAFYGFSQLVSAEEGRKAYYQLLQQMYTQLCLKLQINQSAKDGETYSDGKVIAYWLETHDLFRDLNVPETIPFLFLCQPKLGEKDFTAIRDLLSRELSTISQLAFLYIPNPDSSFDNIQRTIDKKIRRPYAHNLVVLGPRDLERVITTEEPRLELRRAFLSQVDLLSVSPFIVTGPTSGKMFFGREQELRTITEKAQIASFAVIGSRRMGKTSVLRRLHHTRLPGAGFRTLYHDCSTTSSYESFLASTLHDWQPSPPPQTPTTFYDLLQSPPTDRPLVLLLDEADKLIPIDSESNWQLLNTLRALANSGRAQFIFSGERSLRRALQDSTGPLFNFANEMMLGPLDFQSVEELVTRPMKQLEIELINGADTVHRIYDFTSGHPNVIQRLCRRLIERLKEQDGRQISLDDVNAVITDPGFQRDDFLSTYWETATVLEKIISLLIADDENICTLKTVRQALVDRCDLHPKAREVDEALQLLVDLRSILRRTPTGYKFTVEAFPRVVSGTMTLNDMLEILTEEYRDQQE